MRTYTCRSAAATIIRLCLFDLYHKTALKQPVLIAGAGIAAHHGNSKLDVKGDVMRESAFATPEILNVSRSRSQGWQLARYKSHPRRDCTTMPVWLRGIAVLLILSVVGCAGTNRARTYGTYKPEPQFRLPAGAKVALIEGQFDKELFDQELSLKRRHSQGADGPLIQSPGVGAVAGAGLGAVGGGLGGAIYGFTCGPLVVICAPLFAAVGVVAGGVVGAVKGAQAGAANAARYSKDESKNVKDPEQSSDVASEAGVKAALQFIEKSVSSIAPLPDRVKLLVAPLSEQPEYLIEFNPPEANFLYFAEESAHSSKAPEKLANFRISCRARVVRFSDKSVLDSLIYHENISLTPGELVAPQTTATTKSAISKLNTALDLCAERFANYWIIPAIGAGNIQNSSESVPASVVTPNEDYLECVKRGVGKCDDYVSCFSGGRRQWTNKSKCDSRNVTESAKEQIRSKNEEPLAKAIPPAANPVKQGSSSVTPMPIASTTEAPPPPEPAVTRLVSRAPDTATVRGASRAPLVGDTWTYRLVDEYQERTLATVTHVVAAVTQGFVEENITVKERARSRSQEKTPLGIELTELRLGEGLTMQQFSPFLGTQMELEVGGNWNNIPGLHYSSDKWQTTARVVDQEKIKLPAGEFDTFRVEIEAQNSGSVSGGSDSSVKRVTMTEWFVPAIKRVVKITRKTYDHRERSIDIDRYELLSYKQN